MVELWATLDDEGKPYPRPAILHFMPSLAFAALQLKEGDKARKILFESMQKVPWLFGRLLKELNLDVPPSIWGIEPRNDAETLFTEMYVSQTKDLWNAPEAQSLLMEVGLIIPKVNISTVPRVDNSEMTLDVARFLYLDNTPALMALVPSHLLHRSNNSDSDPIPPDVSIYSYEAQQRALEGHDDPRGMGGDFMNPLAAIARLLPDLRARGDPPSEEVQEQMREELENAISTENFVMGSEDGTRRVEGVSLARRLMNIFWPDAENGDGVNVDDEEEEREEWEDEVNTETDEELPALVAPEGDDDDDTPDLVPR